MLTIRWPIPLQTIVQLAVTCLRRAQNSAGRIAGEYMHGLFTVVTLKTLCSVKVKRKRCDLCQWQQVIYRFIWNPANHTLLWSGQFVRSQYERGY